MFGFNPTEVEKMSMGSVLYWHERAAIHDAYTHGKEPPPTFYTPKD